MRINLSKNGNLVYRGYGGYWEGYYWVVITDCPGLNVSLETKEDTLDLCKKFLEEEFILEAINENKPVYVPCGKIKGDPDDWDEIVCIEISKEVTDKVLDYIKRTGKKTRVGGLCDFINLFRMRIWSKWWIRRRKRIIKELKKHYSEDMIDYVFEKFGIDNDGTRCSILEECMRMGLINSAVDAAYDEERDISQEEIEMLQKADYEAAKKIFAEASWRSKGI